MKPIVIRTAPPTQKRQRVSSFTQRSMKPLPLDDLGEEAAIPIVTSSSSRVRAPDPMTPIKRKIDQLLEVTNGVIDRNKEFVEILQILNPIVDSLNETLPPFVFQAKKFFANEQNLKETTTTATFLSSASVRPPLEAFVKRWEQFRKIIEVQYQTHPSAHSTIISDRFMSIRQTLDYFVISNDRRSYPNPLITECVWSLQSLCDSLSKNIVDLFTQPTFPFFQTDLCSSFSNDIKSFLTIVSNTCNNEFKQSGMNQTDQDRQKANILNDGNLIVAALQCAFKYHIEMRQILDLYDPLNDELQSMIEILSKPFTVVQPNPENLLPKPKEVPKQEDLLEDIDEAEFIKSKIRQFVDSFTALLPKDLENSDNNTNDVHKAPLRPSLVIPIKNNSAESLVKKPNPIKKIGVTKPNKTPAKTKADFYDPTQQFSVVNERIMQFKNLLSFQKQQIDQQAAEIKQLKEDLAARPETPQKNESEVNVEDLQNDLKQKTEEINELKNRPDPLPLRNCIHDVAKVFSRKYRCSFQIPEHCTDTKLIAVFEELVNNAPDPENNRVDYIVSRLRNLSKIESNDPMQHVTEIDSVLMDLKTNKIKMNNELDRIKESLTNSLVRVSPKLDSEQFSDKPVLDICRMVDTRFGELNKSIHDLEQKYKEQVKTQKTELRQIYYSLSTEDFNGEPATIIQEIKALQGKNQKLDDDIKLRIKERNTLRFTVTSMGQHFYELLGLKFNHPGDIVSDVVKFANEIESRVSEELEKTNSSNDIKQSENESYVKQLQGFCSGEYETLRSGIDFVASSFTDQLHLINELKEKNHEMKNCLIDIADMLQQFDYMSPKLSLDADEFDIVKYVKERAENTHAEDMIKADDVNKLFNHKGDPKSYLPQVAERVKSTEKTLKILIPFAAILGDIFESFKSKPNQTQDIMSSVGKLRDEMTKLNEITINSDVYVFLSRFVSLTEALAGHLAMYISQTQ